MKMQQVLYEKRHFRVLQFCLLYIFVAKKCMNGYKH